MSLCREVAVRRLKPESIFDESLRTLVCPRCGWTVVREWLVPRVTRIAFCADPDCRWQQVVTMTAPIGRQRLPRYKTIRSPRDDAGNPNRAITIGSARPDGSPGPHPRRVRPTGSKAKKTPPVGAHICVIPGCTSSSKKARGMCLGHYQRWRLSNYPIGSTYERWVRLQSKDIPSRRPGVSEQEVV